LRRLGDTDRSQQEEGAHCAASRVHASLLTRALSAFPKFIVYRNVPLDAAFIVQFPLTAKVAKATSLRLEPDVRCALFEEEVEEG